MLSFLICFSLLMKESETMETKEKIAYAKKVLKQYKSNDYLADFLGIEPDLQTDGTIRNLDEFIEIKNKTKNPLTCETPIEKIAAIAPRAVASILEGIHSMRHLTQRRKTCLIFI